MKTFLKQHSPAKVNNRLNLNRYCNELNTTKAKKWLDVMFATYNI